MAAEIIEKDKKIDYPSLTTDERYYNIIMEPFYINRCSSTSTKITCLLRDRRKLLQNNNNNNNINNYDDKSFSNYLLNSDNYSYQEEEIDDDNDKGGGGGDDCSIIDEHNQHNATLNRKISNRFTIDLFRRNTISSMNLVFIILLVILVTTKSSFAARQEALSSSNDGCMFPKRWEGQWFQSGVQQPITIEGSSLSSRGKCVASEGDKFLLVNKGCHRCVVIYEKHKNILQYKESECDEIYRDQMNPAAMPIHSIIHSDHSRGVVHPNMNSHSRLSSSDQLLRSNDDSDNCMGCKGRETLQFLCEQIPGDALLYSMFKINAEPVKCPLKGPFTFTYNRGNGECKSPVSNIESCTEESRLLLSFQACPDVSGTESTVEELTCLATWKDGNARYLVGLVSHHHATSNEERFRCFVWEKISGSSKDAEYKLAQSGDATCNGLESAEVGSRIMTLRKAPPAERCDFPAWFKGPRHWHALMGNANYVYHPSDGSMHIVKPSGYLETRALCEQINKQTSTEMMAVVHHTTGCQSGFMCMMFYRRDTHVAEVQMGTPAIRLEDACASNHFDLQKTPIVTLLASNPESQICPLEGLYTLRGAIGPPYMTSRHKRNHSNKGHQHHHHDVGHRRHSSLSFRNQEDQNYWHMQGRSISMRHRRSTALQLSDVDQPEQETRLKRDIPGCITNYNSQRQLLVGCTDQNVIEVKPQCNDDGDEVYTCHGHWQDNQTTFIIAKHAGSQHGVCISYKPNELNTAQLIIGDSCYRPSMVQSMDHRLVANLTVFGKCGDTSSSSSVSNYWILICLIAWTIIMLTKR